MRTLLKIHIDAPPGNEAIRDGSLQKTIETLVDQLHPEATYFFPEHGKRCAYFFFDLADPSRIPVVCEPLFARLGAEVDLTPVMSLDDLRSGLTDLARSS